MNKFERAGLSLLITGFVSCCLLFFLFVYYDELHIKSTDHQLQDNLTHTQVILDIVKTVLITSLVPTVVAICVYWINKLERVPRSGIAAGIVCWCLMFSPILYLSIYHYREISTGIENERQWRLEQRP